MFLSTFAVRYNAAVTVVISLLIFEDSKEAKAIKGECATSSSASRDSTIMIIVKEKSIFTNVTSPTAKAKLRLLFEVAPLGLLIEKAGGYSSDGYKSVLDKVIEDIDDRTQVAYGSKNEIIRFEETLYGSSRLKDGVPVGATA
ncbi:sedoheptulose-bisphosphatase [Trifolium repens]|nr:sedoheptulose-bisphosphatase [Trifolium repens]